MPSKRTILVTGATGAQGGGVARNLLAKGSFAVRALTRNPGSDAARKLESAGAQVVAGDLADTDSIRAAARGCYGVFGVTNFWEHFEKEHAHGINLVDAVNSADVQHFVMSTLPSVKKQDPNLNVPHFEIKAQIEEYARGLGVPTTFIHVAFYYENFMYFFPPQKGPDGAYSFGFPQGETPLAGVSVEDVGGVVARVFEDRDRFLGQVVGIVGDDIPSAKYAEILTRELGKKITYNYVPREVFAKFGFPGAEDLADMFEFNRLYVPSRRVDIEQSRALYPAMQSFESWVRNNKEKLLAALKG